MDNEELTLAEIANEPEFVKAGVNASTLRTWINRGELPGRKRAKTWFTTREAVRACLERQRDPHKVGPKMRALRQDTQD